MIYLLLLVLVGCTPHDLVDPIVLVDSNAVEDRVAAESIARMYSAPVLEYPEFNDIFNHDSILIGSCSQVPMNRFVNIWVDCLSMRDNQAIIRFTRTEGSNVLVIVGDTPQDTARAVDAYVRKDPRITDDSEVIFDGELRIGEPT